MNNTSTVRKLYRSRRQKVIGGVCGGFAEYTGMDASLMRVLWVLAALFNGAGIVAYLVCLIFLRENPDVSVETKSPTPPRTEMTIGLVLILVGAAFLLYNVTGFEWWLPWRWHDLVHVHIREIWPILLIVLGAWILLRSRSDDIQEATIQTQSFLRSKTERMVGGVCGGLAEYWQVDVGLIRVIWVLTSLFISLPAGGILYLVLLVLVPEARTGDAPNFEESQHASDNTTCSSTI